MKTRFRWRVPNAFGALVMAFLLVVPGLGAQQGGTVTGRVLDASTGQPIPAVQVFISSLDLGGLSQQNGRYLLQNVPAGTHALAVARIGYRTTEVQITVGGGQTVEQNFSMTLEALQLDEIIVTGTPGGTQRRAIGNAVVRLDAALITERATITNLQDLLAARAPGVQFGRTSGNVGGGTGILIRGVSSLELSFQPLIYVDGIRIDNDQSLGPDIGGGRQSSAMNDINPDDIESIEIVKGPAAATLYGTEASAGVIQIITKKGREGSPEFTFTTRQGVNYMVNPIGKIGRQYYCQPNADGSPRSTTQRCPNADGSPLGPDGMGDLIRTYNIYKHERDFNNNELFGYGHGQGYTLSVRGGTAQVRYYLSGEWSDDNGIVDYNWDTKKNLRANITVLLSENFSLDVSTGYNDGQTRFASPTNGEGGIWQDMMWAFGYRLNSINTSAREAGLRGFQEHTPENVADVESTRKYTRFTGSIQANHSYGGWLTQRLIIGTDKAWDTNRRFVPLDPNGFYPENRLGEVLFERPQTTTETFDYSVSGRRQLTDAIGSTTSFGAQYNRREFIRFQNVGSGFGSPLQRSINETIPANIDVTFQSRENKTLGFYVQQEFSWNDRLFVTGAVRADDASTFGSEFDLVYYPKVSGTWVISEEDFWGIDQINSLRVRSAWGKAGRQPGTFAAQTLYEAFPGPGGTAALALDEPGNSQVGPERSTEIEVGLDVALFSDRLSAEFTLFRQTVTDALTDQDLAPSLGRPGDVDSNLGELQNRGWELALDARLIQRPNLRFDLAAMASKTRNKITSLGEGILSSANFQIGHPYPTVVGAVVTAAELDPATGLLDKTTAMCDSGFAPPGTDAGGEPWPANLQGGTPVRCDSNPEFQLLYGPRYPVYTLSIAPTLTLFNDLQLFAVAEGQYGRWIADIAAEFGSRRNNTLLTVCRCDAIMQAADPANYDDERYFGRVDASFWKMREMGARYTLPQDLVGRMGADRASISVSARNLFNIWVRSPFDLGGKRIPDPELGSNSRTGIGVTTYELPGIASVNFSLRVTF